MTMAITLQKPLLLDEEKPTPILPCVSGVGNVFPRIGKQQLEFPSMTSRQPTNRNRACATGLTITLLAGSLLMAGCETSSNWFAGNTSPTPPSELGLQQFGNTTTHARSYFDQEAQQHRLPEQYLSEARIGLAEIESSLAAAKAFDVAQDATLREGLARVSASRSEAQAREAAALAEADKLREQYSAKQEELWAGIASRERKLSSTSEKNTAMLDAMCKERDMVHAELTSRAQNEYSTAQAKIDRLREVRRATANEGEAMLTEMRQQAEATESRAAATVSKLRSEAQSVREQSNARAEQLTVQINSTRKQSKAESARLASDASSLEKNSLAQFNELMARAVALDEQASQEQYELKVSAANTALRKAKAEYERMLAQATNTRERAQAEVERLQGEAENIAYLGEANFKNGTDELNAWKKSEDAEISKIRFRADRIERDARAEFIKAEARARANALRETAAHQNELAEAQMKAIIAEAEHEAARVRAQILEELATRQKQNSVEVTGKTDPDSPDSQLPEGLHEVPEVPTVAEVTPKVEPEHIAGFRSELAKVMQLRASADAQQMALNATFEESQSNLLAVRAQFDALSAEKLAIAEAMTTQASAQFADLTTQANSWLAVADADYERAITNADAFRKEAMAEAAELRAEAAAAREFAVAQAELLRIESGVIAKHGESEARALEAALEATRRRGEAEYNRLWVEADSVEQANQALAHRINAQIASAERVLAAELSKLDRSIDSSIAIAQANYDEAMVHADVFARKTDVEIDRLRSTNDLEFAMASAEIDHLRNLTYATTLKADATVGRVLAEARADREQSEAISDVAAAMVRAQSDMARAEIIASSRAAGAREEAVRATFDARLVQVQSERIREISEAYQDDFYKRANLETSLAQAEAARSQMNERFAQLKTEQHELQRSARQNWDARLATMQRRERTPQMHPQLGLPQPLENAMFTNVPLNRD